MDQENTQKETPLPPYAVGTKILLIDPDIASLKHTTSILEESTYRVTGIPIPDVALSMMKEKTNGFDLVIAAANMPGIDCLTYLRSLMAISETPIVLISYVADFQLISTALRQGISHFLEKPIKVDEARGLWQFVIRKPRKIIPKKAKNDSNQNKDIMTSNNVKGKGKEIMVQSHNKRKRIDDGKIDNYLNKGKKSDFISNGGETSEDLQWKPQLHGKFMDVLGDDMPQATSGQAKTLNATVRVQAQPTHHLQSSDKETNKQMSASPSTGTGVNATNINNNNFGNSGTIMLRPQTPNLLQNSSILGNVPNFVNQNNSVPIYTSAPCNNNSIIFGDDMPQATSGQATKTLNANVRVQAQPTHHLQSSDKETNKQMSASPSTTGMGVNAININNNNFGNSGTIMLRPQTPNLIQNSNLLGNVPNFVHQNNHVPIYTSAPCNNNSIILAGNNYGNSMTNGINVNPKPFGSSEKKSKLGAIIDQIRHDYWTKEKPEKDAEDKLNEPVISDEEIDMLLEPDLPQNGDEQQANVIGETGIQEFGDTNFDDIYLDDILAELLEDFGA